MAPRTRGNNQTAKPEQGAANESPSVEAMRRKLRQCMRADRNRLRRRLRGIDRARSTGKSVGHPLKAIAADLEKAIKRREQRESGVPRVSYPEELPVSARRDEIKEAIANYQVVVICGETGSGKTTQLPKICLELGRGIDGFIGHTQPRRLAARSVAARIAEELGGTNEKGSKRSVGYKVRFTDETSPSTYIKLMTDGILLAETQGDPRLEQYDTIIIDEAHERSLNIDFLLGYLRNLLPKRPDLKVIITSATIDPQRFADHFSQALRAEVPIIEVSGRTYPVEIKYRPLRAEKILNEDGEESTTIEEVDLIDGVVHAVNEAGKENPQGDILVFMPGEREIRDTAEALEAHFRRIRTPSEVLPLYARLSPTEQQRVFTTSKKRRIVIATNVAETSLTVPGIKFVIDPGLARINRYSARSKVQRLPVEAISQASANQRAGRCGRIAPGICYRLYDENEFLTRPEFTEPEIRRTNLASVVLQMISLKLGRIEDFPFVEPPDRRQIRDGIDTLVELGAIDQEQNLTDVGRELARLPVDPRIGRMILGGANENCLEDILIIASGVSIQDPRLRPTDKQNDADVAHEAFADDRSDFLALKNVWAWYRAEKKKHSGRKLQRICRDRFLSFLRLREWEDVHRQLVDLIKELGYRVEGRGDYAEIHRALLAGLLGTVGSKKNRFEYAAPHGVVYSIFPGSGLFNEKPAWIMAGEVVQTTRTYARMAAQIEPRWVERVGAHLVTKRYSDPKWDERRGKVLATEHVTLFGLPIYTHHNADYSHVNEAEAREMFIHYALVEGEYGGEPVFLKRNAQTIAGIEDMEAKARQRDILVDKVVRFSFYDDRIPRSVVNRETFESWLANEEKRNPTVLVMAETDLIDPEAGTVEGESFPDQFSVGETVLPLTYAHEPGKKEDGVTMSVPVEALPRVDAAKSEWLVPGMRKEKVEALLKALPKPIRRQFVPISEYAERIASALRHLNAEGSFREAVRAELQRMSGVPIPDDAMRTAEIPEHLRMNFRVLDGDGEVLDESRDLNVLRQKLSKEMHARLTDAADEAYRRDGITTWDFGELPEVVEFERSGTTLKGWPALVDQGSSVSLRLLGAKAVAHHATVRGLRRLFLFEVGREVAYQVEHLPGIEKTIAYAATLGKSGLDKTKLFDQIAAIAVDFAFLANQPIVRTHDAFVSRLDSGWHRVGQASQEAAELAGKVLAARHALLLDLDSKAAQRWEEA
ncbi:MAG: ATP-dependent RNA helicase HrpA, partial [Planctomycetota bacterium]